ncbi:DinB family protein [Bacillaceae bacterium SIJ1]|nr:DinB family protein [Litoribacterium kuwaitense]
MINETMHQLDVVVETILKLMEKLDETHAETRPTSGKFSIGELCAHLSLIPEADWRIANEASEEEMALFYEKASPQTIKEAHHTLQCSFEYLKKDIASLLVEEWAQETTSFWGVTYTKFSWLLEILTHLHHHRGQLHALMVHVLAIDPEIPMFE